MYVKKLLKAWERSIAKGKRNDSWSSHMARNTVSSYQPDWDRPCNTQDKRMSTQKDSVSVIGPNQSYPKAILIATNKA